jgi:hypothetical protein
MTKPDEAEPGEREAERGLLGWPRWARLILQLSVSTVVSLVLAFSVDKAAESLADHAKAPQHWAADVARRATIAVRALQPGTLTRLYLEASGVNPDAERDENRRRLLSELEEDAKRPVALADVDVTRSDGKPSDRKPLESEKQFESETAALRKADIQHDISETVAQPNEVIRGAPPPSDQKDAVKPTPSNDVEHTPALEPSTNELSDDEYALHIRLGRWASQSHNPLVAFSDVLWHVVTMESWVGRIVLISQIALGTSLSLLLYSWMLRVKLGKWIAEHSGFLLIPIPIVLLGSGSAYLTHWLLAGVSHLFASITPLAGPSVTFSGLWVCCSALVRRATELSLHKPAERLIERL